MRRTTVLAYDSKGNNDKQSGRRGGTHQQVLEGGDGPQLLLGHQAVGVAVTGEQRLQGLAVGGGRAFEVVGGGARGFTGRGEERSGGGDEVRRGPDERRAPRSMATKQGLERGIVIVVDEALGFYDC